MKTHSLDDPAHRKSRTWLKITGAAATGKKAKRKIHRSERHQARQTIHSILSSIHTQNTPL